MLPLICPQNADGASPNAAAPTSSNSHRKPPTASSSTLFRSDSPLPDHEKTDEKPVDKFLWRGVCRRMGIKDFLSEQASVCEYTWEVVACMIITGEGCSGPDIWPETINQDTGTEDMTLTTWSKEAMKQKEINPQQQYPPSPSPRKACYTTYTSCN